MNDVEFEKKKYCITSSMDAESPTGRSKGDRLLFKVEEEGGMCQRRQREGGKEERFVGMRKKEKCSSIETGLRAKNLSVVPGFLEIFRDAFFFLQVRVSLRKPETSYFRRDWLRNATKHCFFSPPGKCVFFFWSRNNDFSLKS